MAQAIKSSLILQEWITKTKKQSKQTYNFNTYKENKDIKIEIEKRYNILNFIIILALLVLVISLFVVQVVGKEKYETELEN